MQRDHPSLLSEGTIFNTLPLIVQKVKANSLLGKWLRFRQRTKLVAVRRSSLKHCMRTARQPRRTTGKLMGMKTRRHVANLLLTVKFGLAFVCRGSSPLGAIYRWQVDSWQGNTRTIHFTMPMQLPSVLLKLIGELGDARAKLNQLDSHSSHKLGYRYSVMQVAVLFL